MPRSANTVKVKVRYFALLREERGLGNEELETTACNPAELYAELKSKYDFSLGISHLKAAVNSGFADWQTALNDGDEIVFIPPVAGG